MKARLRLFLEWGITFTKPYQTAEKSHRKVYYADKNELEMNILKSQGALKLQNAEPTKSKKNANKGIHHTAPVEMPSGRPQIKKNKEFKQTFGGDAH